MAAFLVVLVASGMIIFILRMASSAAGGPGSGGQPLRTPLSWPQQSARSVAPDDDPEFLRMLARRDRRGEGPAA